jgi:hypothetical protein
MNSEEALHDIAVKANEAVDFISYDDKDELEKLDYITEAMRDVVDIIYLFQQDNPNITKFIEGT